MSLYVYERSRELELYCHNHDYGFYNVIQCAMRLADTDNTEKLKAAWPLVYEELAKRCSAPGGVLPGD